MNVTLIKNEAVFSINLPEKIKGRYWISDNNAEGDKRNLLAVEANDGKWIIKNTHIACIVNSEQEQVEDVELQSLIFFHVKIYDENEIAHIYAQDVIESNQIFDKYVVKNNTQISIGRDESKTIFINNRYVSTNHAIINYVDDSWTVSDENSTNGTFVNDKRVTTQKLNPGDVIYIVGFKLVVGHNYISINNPNKSVRIDSDVLHIFPNQIENHDDVDYIENSNIYFYRTPRFKRDIESMNIKVDAPPQIEKLDTVPLPLLIGPSMTMGMASMSSGAFTVINTINNGTSMMNAMPTLAMSVSMLLGMVMWPILTKKHEKKEKMKSEKDRQNKYKEYLFSIRDAILKEEKLQSEILFENNISTEQCINRIINVMSNLWERTNNQNDFLSIRIGLGDIPLRADLQFPEQKFSISTDNLLADMFALANESKDLKMVPITYSIIESSVSGIIGKDKKSLYDFVMSMIVKIVALHSYDEVKIVLIINENERKYWEALRWLPHLWNDTYTVRYFATNLKEAKELSAGLEQIYFERKENKSKEIPVPYFVIINTNKQVAEKTEIYEKVLEDEENKGFSIINVYEEFRMLPKETTKVIEVDPNDSKIYDKNDISGKATNFMADIELGQDIHTITKAIANIKLDLSSQKFELPDMITFLDMYGVSKIEHLNPLMRWRENNPTSSLAAPVGVDTMGELFTLDLHEKFQGPHGLVAGMTGSGKSEFIITYILSMAVNYHPDEVAFILIDYKGGGLTGAFEDKEKGIKLPHLAGTITNLDGAAVKRSLISIQSELRRRQAVFNEARRISNEGTMDIYKYQKLYRNKIVNDPIPHLFIISDEFAELKTQQPEFMEQLISAARIGRSLGVHLILATQKPNGVVDDQIWSNTRFRVCLKVQEKADSNDMIKRPDAAELSHTGRFYLQVGFNELFAKGQSAWCGAPYYVNGAEEKQKNVVIKVIDNTGKTIKEIKEDKKNVVEEPKIKQIVAIVKYLSDLAIEENIHERPLWMDEIPPIIFSKDLIKKYNVENKEDYILEPVVGEIDDPFNQDQRVFTIPITNNGNTLIYGSAGSGKLTFITTMIYELIRTHSPKYLALYLLDFGSETLKYYEKAPQVGGVVLSSERERVVNLLKMLRNEINERKKTFSDYGGDFVSYIRNSETKCPNIVVVINNYSAFTEMYEDCDDILSFLTREGSKYGIFFVITAANTGAVRYKIVQNFRNVYVMQLNDKSDYAAILGSVEGTFPSKHKGRGLLKTEHTYEFQTAYVAYEDEITDEIKKLINQLNEKYSDDNAKKIPVLPNRIDSQFFKDVKISIDKFPVGIDKKNLEIVSYNLTSNNMFFVLANDIDMTINYVQGMAEIISECKLGVVNVIDAANKFINDDNRKYEYCNSEYDDGAMKVYDEVLRRHKIIKNGDVIEDDDFMICIISDFNKFTSSLAEEVKKKFVDLLAHLKREYNTIFILADEAAQINKMSFEEWYKNQCANITGMWLGDGCSDQYTLKITKVTSELYQEMPSGFGIFINKGRYRIIKSLSSGLYENEE